MPDGGHIEGALNTEGITRAMRSILPATVSVAVLDPRLDQGRLLPEENGAMKLASLKRYREFTAGRVASRHAMLAMGLPGLPVPVAENRAPVWPQGVTGSITHSETCCIAATAPAREIAALGIDVEECQPLEDPLFDSICTEREKEWLFKQAQEIHGLLGKLFFSAKESVFKCQFPVSSQMIDFEAIELMFDFENQTFAAEFACPVPPFAAGDMLLGRFAMANDLILTSVTLGE